MEESGKQEKKKNQDSTPYDSAYKALFSNPKVIQDFVLYYLNKMPFTKDLDLRLESMERMPTNFISKELLRRDGDLIWKLRWKKDQDFYLLLWLEFQSRIDKFMANRLCTYISLFHNQLIKKQKIKDYLPPVMPIVAYCGNKKWDAPTELIELYPPQTPPELLPYQPSIKYYIFDEKRVPVNKSQGKDLDSVSTLLLMEKIQTKEDYEEIFDIILGMFTTDPALEQVGKNLLNLLDSVHKFSPSIDIEKIRNRKESPMTIRENVKRIFKKEREEGIQEGMEKGIEKGIERGMEKGIEKGERKKALQIAEELLKKGTMKIEDIMQVTGLSSEDIFKIHRGK